MVTKDTRVNERTTTWTSKKVQKGDRIKKREIYRGLAFVYKTQKRAFDPLVIGSLLVVQAVSTLLTTLFCTLPKSLKT